MAPRGRILIVDDEANARAALSEILHEDGFVTDTAADAAATVTVTVTVTETTTVAAPAV